MRNLILFAFLSIFSFSSFAQGAAQMAYGIGATYFMPDEGSAFGSWGSNEGGLDGFNVTANLNFDMLIWDNYFVRLGSDAHYFRAIETNKTSNIAGISPHFGLGKISALENGHVLRYGLTMGISQIRTWEKDRNLGTTTAINASSFLWGSLAVPAGISFRYEIPSDKRTYYIGADYRYLMFDDGIDGVGVGRRVGYDDQMLTFSFGVNNKKKYRSKKLASLESEAAKSRAVTSLKKELIQAREESDMVKDELEVANLKITEVNRQLDSLELFATQAKEEGPTAKKVEKESQSKKTRFPSLSKGSYVVVLGSFENKSLASRYSASIDYGLPVNMFKANNNYYRVFLGPFPSFMRAKEVLNEVPGRAWILKKK